MENLLDPVDQGRTQPIAPGLEASETETACEPSVTVEDETTNEPDVIDQSSTTLTRQAKKALPGKVPIKPARVQEEMQPNPLLLDPYEWNRCTITVGYSLLPNGQVTVSVHNHKDEPIIKEFPAEEVPLPEKISNVMATLQRIWIRSPVNTTVVLLPKPEMAFERPMIASVQVSTDTPIVQEGVESDLTLPALIIDMLEELKELMPARALKNMEKNARAKTPVKVKTANKAATPKAAAPASMPAVNKNIDIFIIRSQTHLLVIAITTVVQMLQILKFPSFHLAFDFIGQRIEPVRIGFLELHWPLAFIIVARILVAVRTTAIAIQQTC